jgi:FlaG/FlaF family flagellin (archaellin)
MNINIKKVNTPVAVKINVGDTVVRGTNRYLSANTEYTVEKVFPNGLLGIKGIRSVIRPSSVTLVKSA